MRKLAKVRVMRDVFGLAHAKGSDAPLELCSDGASEASAVVEGSVGGQTLHRATGRHRFGAAGGLRRPLEGTAEVVDGYVLKAEPAGRAMRRSELTVLVCMAVRPPVWVRWRVRWMLTVPFLRSPVRRASLNSACSRCLGPIGGDRVIGQLDVCRASSRWART